MNGESVEVEIRSLFANLKTDKVESLLIQLSDWGLNIRMFLNGDHFELDLIKNFKGYEVTFVDHSDKDPVQLNELSELIQINPQYRLGFNSPNLEVFNFVKS